MRFHVVIPARFASTRLPAKPLVDIGGLPMVQHVVARACDSAADEVWVATDDARIAAVVSDPRHAGRDIAVMTDPSLPSGTDRVAAVASQRGWPDDTIVVNVQGDEPFIAPAAIDQAAALLASHPEASIATLVTPIVSDAEFMNPNVVKAVLDPRGRALYFSRAPIPWNRDASTTAPGVRGAQALRHIGLYAYRVGALRDITRLAPSRLESIEKLEQLRALEHGFVIVAATTAEPPAPGIDTEDDLREARMRYRGTQAHTPRNA